MEILECSDCHRELKQGEYVVTLSIGYIGSDSMPCEPVDVQYCWECARKWMSPSVEEIVTKMQAVLPIPRPS